ncbi:MAG TPA: flavodoxin domain-containing protein [Bacteriovoracaceae bacterium]|nr:flavodoxin domain-containing protein [Bacteriovoracaceae bacterium]
MNPIVGDPVHILYGSQSGNAQNLATTIGEAIEQSAVAVIVSDLGEVNPEEIFNIRTLIIVTSTYGDGEAPDNASEWLSYLKFGDDLDLGHLRYAVMGLGDTYYPHFCQCGKDFDQYLSKRGAHAMLKRLDCDLYFEEQYGEWLNELVAVLKK